VEHAARGVGEVVEEHTDGPETDIEDVEVETEHAPEEEPHRVGAVLYVEAHDMLEPHQPQVDSRMS
jgi:hypothetical protein